MNLQEDPEVRAAIEAYREAREAFDRIRMIPLLNRRIGWERTLGKADSRQLTRARDLAGLIVRLVPPQ